MATQTKIEINQAGKVVTPSASLMRVDEFRFGNYAEQSKKAYRITLVLEGTAYYVVEQWGNEGEIGNGRKRKQVKFINFFDAKAAYLKAKEAQQEAGFRVVSQEVIVW